MVSRMETGIAYARMESPVGPLWVAQSGAGVCVVGLGAGQPEGLFAWLARHIGSEEPREDGENVSVALVQLREYFSRARKQFDLLMDMRGTVFQKAVWHEVASIPYGETATYGQIAQRIGRPTATRAVGAAVGANPLPILIPCHRVVGAGGALTGYSGGLEIKKMLLRIEGSRISCASH